MTKQIPDDANERINGWMEKLAFAAITMGVTVTATFQWQLYKDNAEVRQLLKAHDQSIVYLQNEMASIKGQMVGWDTLKRIELYLGAHPASERGTALSDAIKMERESRKQ